LAVQFFFFFSGHFLLDNSLFIRYVKQHHVVCADREAHNMMLFFEKSLYYQGNGKRLTPPWLIRLPVYQPEMKNRQLPCRLAIHLNINRN
jgi:hypothetical protein